MQAFNFVDAGEMGNYFEGVALVDEESLAFGGVVHFVGVF